MSLALEAVWSKWTWPVELRSHAPAWQQKTVSASYQYSKGVEFSKQEGKFYVETTKRKTKAHRTLLGSTYILAEDSE